MEVSLRKRIKCFLFTLHRDTALKATINSYFAFVFEYDPIRGNRTIKDH